jgi:putative PIG3 family NAD(P)H quinone oxidoreductase
VNRADLLQRRGRYPSPPGAPADVPGLEYAGVVERVGPGVSAWRVGDGVMGLVGGGGYAEYVVVHEDEALAVPGTLALADAAAVPEAFITAHDALFTQAGLRAGESALIHAAASGVGTAALQLVRAAGARAIGTSRSAEKLARLGALGCDVAIPADPDWPDRVLEATDGRGVDVVLELVGGDYLAGDTRVLAPHGRLMIVGLVGGRAAPLDMGVVLGQRLTIRGTVMRARSLDEKIATTTAFARDVLPLLAAGRIHPVIDRVLPAARAMDAHLLLERNATFGKVVLSWELEEG